jgi:hypothetical protein
VLHTLMRCAAADLWCVAKGDVDDLSALSRPFRKTQSAQV